MYKSRIEACFQHVYIYTRNASNTHSAIDKNLLEITNFSGFHLSFNGSLS